MISEGKLGNYQILVLSCDMLKPVKESFFLPYHWLALLNPQEGLSKELYKASCLELIRS